MISSLIYSRTNILFLIFSLFVYLLQMYFNPFVPKVPFVYLMKTSENCKVFYVLNG